jgi:hypothetical protein
LINNIPPSQESHGPRTPILNQLRPQAVQPPALPPPPPPHRLPPPPPTQPLARYPPTALHTHGAPPLPATITAGEPVVVFYEWQVVSKKGKRTAATMSPGEMKRIDKRDTPTRMKPRTSKLARASCLIPPPPRDPPNQNTLLLDNDEGSNLSIESTTLTPTRMRIAESMQPLTQPTNETMNTTMQQYYPTKQPSITKTACANRPQTWQQRFNVPPSPGTPTKLPAAGTQSGF